MAPLASFWVNYLRPTSAGWSPRNDGFVRESLQNPRTLQVFLNYRKIGPDEYHFRYFSYFQQLVSTILEGPIFHFHDFGRKGSLAFLKVFLKDDLFHSQGQSRDTWLCEFVVRSEGPGVAKHYAVFQRCCFLSYVKYSKLKGIHYPSHLVWYLCSSIVDNTDRWTSLRKKTFDPQINWYTGSRASQISGQPQY